MASVAMGATIVETNRMEYSGGITSSTPIEASAATKGNELVTLQQMQTATNPVIVGIQEPGPTTNSAGGTNVWLFCAAPLPKPITLSGRNGSCTSGTGVFDYVYWSPTTPVSSAGTICYTGLVTTVAGTNPAIVVVFPSNVLVGVRLTNAVGFSGWVEGGSGTW